MKRPVFVVGGALILAGGIALGWRWGRPERNVVSRPVSETRGPSAPAANATEPVVPARTAAVALTPAEKAARVERIKRDYEEIFAMVRADGARASASGDLSAHDKHPWRLELLNLLEREQHADLSGVLNVGELEEIDWQESFAGRRVRELLGDTTATEAQRRAVFRLQRDYDERFALTFDVAPVALLARETARLETQEKIQLVLGPVMFGAWLRGEGGTYAGFSDYVTQKNLPVTVALELWRIENDFRLRQLAGRANGAMTTEQSQAAQTSLVQQAEARVGQLVGREALEKDRAQVLGWLPGR